MMIILVCHLFIHLFLATSTHYYKNNAQDMVDMSTFLKTVITNGDEPFWGGVGWGGVGWGGVGSNL